MWLFGYGSLLWKQGFTPLDVRDAHLDGYQRAFTQKSWDHRGTPQLPGRVANLIPADARTFGRIYLLPTAVRDELIAQLDHREKAGYSRQILTLQTASGPVEATTFIGPPGNPDDARNEPLETTARIIATASGPSGANTDYLFSLCDVLRKAHQHDPYTFTLESMVRALLQP